MSDMKILYISAKAGGGLAAVDMDDMAGAGGGWGDDADLVLDDGLFYYVTCSSLQLGSFTVTKKFRN